MATNIVCSDTYIDAFSRLDKKIQKKSLETIRLMQRSLRSDSLKVEKLNTKLDFKSARVTQDFRAIFTQSGNTVLLVYIDHHDDAYLWASRRLQGFDTANAKPVYEYFEQSKLAFDPITGEDLRSPDSREPVRPPKKEKLKKGKIDPSTGLPIGISGKPVHDSTNHETQAFAMAIIKKILVSFIFLYSWLYHRCDLYNHVFHVAKSHRKKSFLRPVLWLHHI